MNSPKSIFTAPDSVAGKLPPTTLRLHQTTTTTTTKRLDDSTGEEKATLRETSSGTEQDCPKSAGAVAKTAPTSVEKPLVLTNGQQPPHQAALKPQFTTPQPKVTRPTHINIATQSSTKRPLDSFQSPATSASHGATESSKKRLRINRPTRHILDSYSFATNPSTSLGPASPLFFSHSPQIRPVLLPRYSSSEAGAKMLSKTNDEDAGIRTVTLARGIFTTGSPPSRPYIKSRGSVDRQSIPRFDSPEQGDRSDPLRMLAHVGITELLEQDDRPTFIVDLGDTANYSNGPLRVVFANSSLRAFPGLLESVSGATEDGGEGTTPGTFPQFRAWIMSAAVNGESLDVCLPSFMRGPFSWSCSTLRKRLRIASGTLLSTMTSTSNPLASASPMQAVSSMNSLPSASVAVDFREPNDYFGSAALPLELESKNQATRNDAVPSIEVGGNNVQTLPPLDSSDTFNAPSKPDSTRSSPISFANECVLSAAAVAKVDDFATTAVPSIGFFDWTRLPHSESLPQHIQFARSIDWASTALGPMNNWPADLRQMCNLIMASPHPAAMYWGEDLVAIYNEAYVLLAGQKHPTLMGQSYREAWAEIWDDVKDVFANAQLTGQATMKDDDCLFIKRNDFLEETYFSWSIIPMVGGDGSVMGLYNPAFEKTRRKIAERRMLTLREVGERTAAARDVKGFWDEVLAALEFNDFDTPFVILYSVGDEGADGEDASVYSSSISSSAKQCYLEGALGVPLGHIAAPETMDLRTGTEGFASIFREVLKSNKPMVLDISMDELPSELLDGLEWRGFGDPAKAVVICPIHPTTGESTLGFLIMGINPRRPYDDDYTLFIQLLSRQLATSLASVVLFEEEIRRGQRAAKLAALDRIELSEQLAIRTQEAIESETKFTRMAEFAPVGMFIASSTGRITFCNDTWYEITRVPKELNSTDRWIDYVLDEDKPLVKQLWHDLTMNTRPANSEFRFKARWLDRHGTQDDTWVLFSAYPEKHEDGTLKSVFGSITNISQQKWAEGFQKRKTEEAVELKRQQENFIDITSHEMRNPLSAILQCSDEIITSLSDARNLALGDTALFDDNIDAAQTIALCAQHQKRIVDDVLTLSKIDSALLSVAPVDVQPLTVVQRALKMFEGELHTADIQMKFVVTPSFKQLGVDWLRFDPSRVLQVLINLTTNAIKFTTTESRRTITISISASLRKPSAEKTPIVNFFPPRAKRVDLTHGPDWGEGDQVYIQFAVEDTGRGLTEEEMKVLFQRFSQASPRTHVQYGGSGLGLFISRELTELQGGEIGVASESGKGSTFAFFIKARRSVEPADQNAHVQTNILPRKASETGEMPSVRKAPAPRARDFAAGAAPSATGAQGKGDDAAARQSLRVLIVEDNLVNQRVLQKQLNKLGCLTYVANHGGEALEMLEQSAFWRDQKKPAKPIMLDVVLMDVEMPVMGGRECIKRIRELQKKGALISHVPVIAVTANARKEQIEALKEDGMDNVVSKPFRVPDLVKEMKALIESLPTASGR